MEVAIHFPSPLRAANPTAWSGAPNQIITISVLLANSAGGNAAYTINCPAGQCNGGTSSILINARINDSYTLTATRPTSVTARTGQTVPVAVRYLVSGQPATLDTIWTVDSVDGNVLAEIKDFIRGQKVAAGLSIGRAAAFRLPAFVGSL